MVKKMKINEFAKRIRAEYLTENESDEREITGIYSCDLLSRVMSRAAGGNAWITVHTHLSTVAVAVFAEIPCIVLPEGIEAEEGTVRRAELEGVAIMKTEMSAFEICAVMGKEFLREDI
jgi:hypothetical protein